jgi:hypothetical protein
MQWDFMSGLFSRHIHIFGYHALVYHAKLIGKNLQPYPEIECPLLGHVKKIVVEPVADNHMPHAVAKPGKAFLPLRAFSLYRSAISKYFVVLGKGTAVNAFDHEPVIALPHILIITSAGPFF